MILQLRSKLGKKKKIFYNIAFSKHNSSQVFHHRQINRPCDGGWGHLLLIWWTKSTKLDKDYRIVCADYLREYQGKTQALVKAGRRRNLTSSWSIPSDMMDLPELVFLYDSSTVLKGKLSFCCITRQSPSDKYELARLLEIVSNASKTHCNVHVRKFDPDIWW